MREGRFTVSVHGTAEMDEDDLSMQDVENAVLTGVIGESQVDSKTRERKYVIRGNACLGERIEVVVKFSASGYVLVITAYAIEK